MVWANTSPLVKKYTLEEFWALPEPPCHSKLELIAGVLYMTPPPGYVHDDIVSRLIDLIGAYRLLQKDSGKLYAPRAPIWTSSNTYLEPDLFYVSVDTRAKRDPKHRTTADLVIEVISPGSAIYDRNTKADTYAALGVKELWLIDEVTETVEVLNQTPDGFGVKKLFKKADSFRSEVLPAFIVPVRQIFED